MRSIEEFIQEKLSDEKIQREYQRQRPFFEIADQILFYRKKAGLSQSELAEKSNTTQAIISRIENGNSNPSLSTIIKIAEILNCTISLSLNQVDKRYISSIINKASRTYEGIKYTNLILSYSSTSGKNQIDSLDRKKIENNKLPESA